MALRPEAVVLVGPEDADARMQGIVSEVYFQGDHALAQVRVNDTAFLASVRDDVLPRRGEPVGLCWDVTAAIPLSEG